MYMAFTKSGLFLVSFISSLGSVPTFSEMHNISSLVHWSVRRQV